MPKSCCAFGCSNHNMMEKKFSFFTFPEKNPERWKKWVKAVNRVNADGSEWKPSKRTVLCSEHFISGRARTDPTHPDFIPSIFKLSKTRLRRFGAAGKRKIPFISPTPSKEQELQDSLDTPTVVPRPSSSEFIATVTPTCSYTPHTGLHKPVSDDDERLQLYEEINVLRIQKANLLKEKKRLKGAVHLRASCVEGNNKKCVFFTGVSWGVFLKTFSFLVTFVKPSKIAQKLDLIDQFFITLVKLRLDLPFKDIGHATDLSTRQVSEVFWKWIKLVSTKLDYLIKWPDREVVRRTLPGPFQYHFPRLTCIFDCFEIVIDRPKKLSARSKFYSNYKKHITVKVLIGCTPNGSISFLSKAWGGRVSDIEIMRQSGFIDPNVHHPHDQILADGRFTLKHDFATLCGAELITPAFIKGKKQLLAMDVEVSRQLSSVRFHFERVIRRIKNTFKILQGTLTITALTDEADELSRIDQILISCAVFVNLGDSLVYQE